MSEKEGLTAAIEMFRWRGEEEEAEETRRSGVDLLFWSSVADNLGAVQALATEGNAYPGGQLKLHRPGKRSQYLNESGHMFMHSIMILDTYIRIELRVISDEILGFHTSYPAPLYTLQIFSPAL